MKNLLGFLALVMLFGTMACGDDEPSGEGKLTLTFKAVYDGEPIVMNEEEYTYFNDVALKFSKLHFFLSEPTVQGDENQELIDILFVDFGVQNRTLEGAEEGVSFTYDLPVGDYTGLNFGIGPNAEQNALLPSDYPSDHPLQTSAGYWTPWSSFIFSKTEGKYDAAGDGSFGTGFVYHIGSDDMYRSLSQVGDFAIKSDKTTEWIITVDYKNAFGDATNNIDIETYPAFHSPQDPTLTELTKMLSDNLQAAFTLSKK